MGGLNITQPWLPYADILLLALIHTSPLCFIQIRPKLPKFVIWGGFWVGRVKGWGGLIIGQTKNDFPAKFHQHWKN